MLEIMTTKELGKYLRLAATWSRTVLRYFGVRWTFSKSPVKWCFTP